MTPSEFRRLFSEFTAPSWQPWNSIEDAALGFDPEDRPLVQRVTGRTVLPAGPVSEVWAIVGRGGGKSREAARLACFFACGRSYPRVAGESIFVGVFAPDRRQATLTFKYVVGLLKSVPALAALIVAERADAVELSNGVIIEVLTASVGAPRGRAYALVIVEEAAFLPTEDSAEPDRELIRAVRPALARVAGSMLVVISSAYAMRGELHRVWAERFGRDGDDDVLVIQADTLTLNPSFPAREIARAYRDDPVAAEAEYGARFRRDVSSLLLADALDAVTPDGVRERAPDPAREAVAHCDAATGSGDDAFAVAVAFVGAPAELAVVRRWAPPFSPAGVAAEAAAMLRRYGVSEVTIDAFAPGLVADLFARSGIECRRADGDTSAAFVGLLGLVNSQGVRLLDDEALRRELLGLERRTGTGGRDRVGHGARGHDDVAAAAAFALVAAAHEAERAPLMLVGSASHADWSAGHGEPEMDGPDDETDDEIEGEEDGARLGAMPPSLGDLVRRAADRLVRAVSPTQAPEAGAARRRERRRQRLAVRARQRREAEQVDQERLRAEAAARHIAARVRQNGGSWFPGDR